MLDQLSLVQVVTGYAILTVLMGLFFLLNWRIRVVYKVAWLHIVL